MKRSRKAGLGTGTGHQNSQNAHSTQSAGGALPPMLPEVAPSIYRPHVDDVRRRAYEIYLRRQIAGDTGSEMNDWLQAERELMENESRSA